MKTFEIVWLAWIVAFAVIELRAAVDRSSGSPTLSETVWRLFAVRSNAGRYAVARRWLWRAFLVLLTLHLGWGWFLS